MAEERLGPRGERRADIRAALICLILASIHRGKGSKPKLEDFLLDFDTEKKRGETQTPAQMERIMRQMAQSFDGSAKKKAAKKDTAEPKREPRKPKEK